MKKPSYLKRVRGRRLGGVVGVVLEMLRRRIAMKRLQKMAVDMHKKYFGGDKFLDTNSIQGNFNDHYEFSCSSSPEGPAPSINSSIYGHGVKSGSGPKNWDTRFLLRALLPSCIRVNDELESELDNVGIPQFIACDEDDDQYFGYMDPQFSDNSYSNECSSHSRNHVSTTTCSNCSFSLAIHSHILPTDAPATSRFLCKIPGNVGKRIQTPFYKYLPFGFYYFIKNGGSVPSVFPDLRLFPR